MLRIILRNNIVIALLLIGLFGCEQDSLTIPTDASGSNSLAGSYARMLAIQDRLYIIDETNLITLDIVDPTTPQELESIEVGEDIETIFYNGSNLFIGSPQGLYIYSFSSNGIPSLQSLTPYSFEEEWVACDPVVANDTLAFVTLSTTVEITNAEGCTRGVLINELRVFDIKNTEDPVLLSITEMEEPKGLALDDTVLFVCEKNDGLRVFDVSNPEAPTLLKAFKEFKAYDVIAYNGLLLLIGPNEIKQYDYTSIENMYEISTLDLK